MSIGTRFTTRAWSPDQVREAIGTALADPCVDAFHTLWHKTLTTWPMTRYRSVPTLKCPLDLQIYHELIIELRPALIIETGTAYGGSALHFHDCLCLAGGAGRVITIDTEERIHPGQSIPWDQFPRITRLRGSSLDPAIQATVADAVAAADGPVLVSLDSAHGEAHVLAELEAYADCVTPGSFLVVEDTDLAGNPVDVGRPDGGPLAAVSRYLAAHPGMFEQERLCERYLLTMHPGGWLRRLIKES